MKIYSIEECPQQSEAWFNVRKLKLTASEAQAIGNNGKGLESYVTRLMAEYLSSAPSEHFTSKDTERGNELEPFAREMYELERGVTVEQVGFIEMNKYVGGSPDGLVGEDGGTEIKCQNDLKHYQLLLKGEKEIDSSYIWQAHMNLLITRRLWWDLIFYNPNFKQSLIIFRIEPEVEKEKALEEGIKTGTQMIKSQLKQFA